MWTTSKTQFLAIRIHNPTGLAVFFGNITSAWGRSRHHGATRPPFRGDDGSYHPPPQFGDGSPIHVDDLDTLLDIAQDGAVNVEWEEGDLVILDVRGSTRALKENLKNQANPC
jgi:hypothetical protein